MGSTGVAPVCNVNVPSPKPVGQKVPLPFIVVPDADNIQSIVAAILELRTAMIALTTLGVPTNNTVNNNPVQNTNVGIPIGFGFSGGANAGGYSGSGSGSGRGNNSNKNNNQNAARGSFVEVQRTSKNVKVSNPNDASQYVMVKQIVKLVLQNKTTGQLWTWSL